MDTHARPNRAANMVLGLLSEETLAAVQPLLLDQTIEKGRTLWDGEPSSRVYLPLSGLISVVCSAGDGKAVEVGCIGRESAAGFSRGQVCSRGIVAGPGVFSSMPLERFWALAAENTELRELAASSTDWLTLQAQRLAACHVTHGADARLARWILQVADRVGKEIRATQEDIANLLGVRRTTLTLVANKLQQGGAISYKRGVILVRDRARLEAIACDCYRYVGQQAWSSGAQRTPKTGYLSDSPDSG
jgi:CRP-like cAMP-binding protein